ncbi:bifunctional UDP-N-acetylmuramoyl-tripeptide:D-alanyl-D-alanine ligase/alanine racemase [Ekhidna sp.]
MLFSHLKDVTGGQVYLTEDIDITHFSVDTRTLLGNNGEVFIAIEGKRDGHDYVRAAIDKGVRNFIVSKELELKGVNQLIVKDTVLSFQKIATNHRNLFAIPVIGITGSNGKTTVKEWLSTILSQGRYVVKSPKSYNSQIGVPLSIMELRQQHEIGVFEAGISKVGEMTNLQNIIKPTFGIFTNLGEAHDDGFDSMEQKLNEKLNLFSDSEKVICNNESLYYDQIQKRLGSKLITWGSKQANYSVSNDSGIINVSGRKFETAFDSSTQLENLTHCIVSALELGLSPEEIQNGLNLVEGVPMRLELKKGINGCYILDDTYNNDEAGLRVAIDYLESHRQNEKRTLILSDILHSAKSDKELYKTINQIIVGRGFSRLIGVGTRISSNANCFSIPSNFYDSTDDLLNQMPEFNDEMVLVKGARNFELERVVQRIEEKSHGTILEVNFEALHHNLTQYQSLLNGKTQLMVMVKANAYGAGLLEVANFMQHQQVDMLGVAYVDEAIQLRKNGISIPIMIMNPYIESFDQFERYDLQAEIFSITHFKRMLRDTVRRPGIHLKIDTGMHRLGFKPNELDDLITLLEANRDVKVEGIFTHFSSAEQTEEDEFTIEQAELFEAAYDRLSHVLGYNPLKHACNSAGIVRWPQYHFDMVRLGIGLHGFDPAESLKLRYPGQLKTVISQIQHLDKGATVGYSRKGLITRKSRIAILPIGYEDGYSRIFGNGNASVSVGGNLCHTVGNVCMDMIMVDVTDTNAKEGDEVTVFGSNPTIEDLAKISSTMPYEILTNVSSRVKRIFVSE